MSRSRASASVSRLTKPSARHSLVCTLLVAALAVGAPSVAEGARGAVAPPDPVVGAVGSWATEGPYETEESDYRLPRIRLSGLPRPVQMVGHVVAPSDAPGARPLALFLHGKHASCYVPDGGQTSPQWPCRDGEVVVPNNEGYRYLQRMLASHGYVTVSIAANGIDGQEDVFSTDSGVSARSALVRRHLRLWADWSELAAGTEWSGRVDMSRVLLVGHSRGGEGVDRAAIDTRPESPWRIVGQVLFAPTSFGRQAAPSVPTVVLMGYCDGDLNWWPGQNYVDVLRDVVPDPALRSAVSVMGANHSFFNTEWTPGLSAAPSGDDAASFYGDRHGLCGTSAPTRLSAAEQRDVAKAYVRAAAALFGYGDRSFLSLLDGRLVRPGQVGGADVRVSALGGNRTMLRPRLDGVVAGSSPQASLCAGQAGAEEPTFCGHGVRWERTPHWVPDFESQAVPVARNLELSWTSAGARGGLTLHEPVDLSGFTHLDARVIVEPSSGPVRLNLRIVDDDGHAVSIVPRGGGSLDPMPGPLRLLGRYWGQTLRAPLADASGVDLARVRTVQLVARNDNGQVWLLDASGWRRGVAPLPAAYVPRVSLRDVTVQEGAGGTRTVDVPVAVVGSLDTRARLSVQVVDHDVDPLPPPSTLVIRPGQHHVTIPVTYRADHTAEPDHELVVNIWARRGAVTGDYQARIVVRDDDRGAGGPAVADGAQGQRRLPA